MICRIGICDEKGTSDSKALLGSCGMTIPVVENQGNRRLRPRSFWMDASPLHGTVYRAPVIATYGFSFAHSFLLCVTRMAILYSIPWST